MSFILDAIAKSEKERRQLEVPNAQVLSIPPEAAPSRKSLLPYLLIAALGINAVLVALWIQTDQVEETVPGAVTQVTRSQQDKVDAEPVAEPVEKAAVDNTETLRVVEVVDADDEPRPEAVEETQQEGWVRIEPNSLQESVSEAEAIGSVVVDSDAGESMVVSQLYDLPDSVRKELPTVKFSGHLYSSNPASSLVFLENQRPVMQGQRIVDDVYLHEITPDGVIVRFQGYLIGVGVLQNWTLN